MITITDKYGRTITITITTDDRGNDVYTFDGVTVSFPVGTPQEKVLHTIEAMAPAEE